MKKTSLIIFAFLAISQVALAQSTAPVTTYSPLRGDRLYLASIATTSTGSLVDVTYKITLTSVAPIGTSLKVVGDVEGIFEDEVFNTQKLVWETEPLPPLTDLVPTARVASIESKHHVVGNYTIPCVVLKLRYDTKPKRIQIDGGVFLIYEEECWLAVTHFGKPYTESGPARFPSVVKVIHSGLFDGEKRVVRVSELIKIER